MKNILGIISEIFRLPRVSIHLNVNDSESAKLYHAFNKRHPRFPLVRKKTIGVMLMDISSFSGVEDYLKIVSGKNSTAYYSRRCLKEGYEFRLFNPNEFQESILAINNSQPERQGVRMGSTYLERFDYPLNEKNSYGGIFFQNELVAYLWLRTQGELVIVNRILGHATHLKRGVMYLLFSSSVNTAIHRWKEARWMMYDTFFGAKEGLKLFKTRLGFKPYIVRWER